MSSNSTISTKLLFPQSDVANRYKAHILLTQGREITKEEAVNELIALGAEQVLPHELLRSLKLEIPSWKK